MKIIDLLKKSGVVTSPYPLQPYEVSENFRGKPKYNYSFCIGCAACGIACPPNAISVKIEDGETKEIVVKNKKIEIPEEPEIPGTP